MKFAYLRWMVRTAVVCIALGATIGVLMQIGYRVKAIAWVAVLRSVHVHLLLVGGVIQMIAGVALWMFPRKVEEPQWPTNRQGWTLYVLLSGGTLLRCASPLQEASDIAYALATAGAVMQLLGILTFVKLVHGRIRGPRLDAREGRA